MKHLSVAFLLLFAAITSFAQKDGKKLESPRAITKSGHISVNYGQPSKKGREIFGGLVPYGQVWRTGANEATTITFNADGMFGGEKVKKGTYTLFTIPEKDSWTIILNSQMNQWGAFKYEEFKDKDVLKIKVPAMHVGEPVEKLTFVVDAENLVITWDNVVVKIPVKF